MSDITEKKRRPGTWAPGQSGNPGGRIAFPAELRRQITEYTPELIERLIELTRNAAKDSDKIKASEVLLDRAFGRPIQAVDVDGKVNTVHVDTASLSQAEKDVLINALVKCQE